MLDQAAALGDEDNAQYSELLTLVAQAEQLDPASNKAADALPILDDATALLDDMTPRMQSIAALLDKAAALDISPEYKTYLGLKRELMQVDLDLYGVLGELIAKDRTAYATWERLSGSERTALLTDRDDLVTQANALATETQEKNAAAEQYFADEQIGEASAESTNTKFWVPGVLAFAALGLLIGWYRRRRRHQGPTSPKSLDEEMRVV